MAPLRFQIVRLAALLAVAFLLRCWQPQLMAIEHFDEGVYAASYFSPQLGFRYPDLHLYAPPLLPSILDWTLVFTGGRPHAVMWVNVLLGTLLVAAVWWTTAELQSGIEVTGSEPPTRAPPAPLKQNAKRRTLPKQTGGAGAKPLAMLTPGAPLAAATLVAFSEMFIQYSRAALTDTAVCLWMTLAVGAGCRALRTGAFSWLIASGVLTALAWWTKYNGWLTLAILGAGTIGWIAFDTIAARIGPALPPATKESPRPVGTFLRWCAIAILATVLWLPCLQALQQYGGYAVVSQNHAGYLVGWQGWLDSLTKHLAVDRRMSRSVTMLGVFLGLQFAGGIFTWNGRGWQRTHLSRVVEYLAYLVAIFALPLTYYAGLIPTVAGGVLIWLAGGITLWNRRDSAANLRFTILLAWLCGLLLATPLYRPYPRLILPLLTGICIATGLGWGELFGRLHAAFTNLQFGRLPAALGIPETPDSPFPSSGRIAGYRPVLFLVGLCAVLCFALPPSPAWQDRRGLKFAAEQIVMRLQEELINQPAPAGSTGSILYVLAEPGLYYHLAAIPEVQRGFISQPAAGLKVLERPPVSPQPPVFLVTGIHARTEAAELSQLTDKVRDLGIVPYQPSDLVLLDEYSPHALHNVRDQQLQLWRVR